MCGEALVVVLDTNLFVAAFWNRRSASARIVGACLDGRFTPAYTWRMRTEMDKILRNTRTTTPYREMVDRLFDAAMLVEPQPVAARTEDPDDQKFLECAASAGADYIITSDAHLLRLCRTGRTEIVTPVRFWSLVESA